MQKRIAVYEKLNIASLCFAAMAGPCFQKQYFIGYDAFLQRYLGPFIKNKIGLKQLHRVNFRNCRGIEAQSSEVAIKAGRKIVEENTFFAGPFIKYMKDTRAGDLIKSLFIKHAYQSAYKYVLLKQVADVNRNNPCIYFPSSKNYVFNTTEDKPYNLSMARGYIGLLNLVGIIKGFAYFAGLLIAPFYLFLSLVIKKKVVVKKEARKVRKKIMFFHRYDKLNFEYHISTRDMYLLNHEIMDMKDCVHISLLSPFNAEKVAHLKKNGGVVFDYHGQKIHAPFMFKRFFVDYYKCFLKDMGRFSFNDFMSFDLLRGFIAVVLKSVTFENILKEIDAKLAFFESAVSFNPDIFTIMANRYNVKTMITMNGYSAYCNPIYICANKVVNSSLVPGRYYDRHFKPNNPSIDKFYVVGNHEIEDIRHDDSAKVMELKKKHKKIVTVFFSFYAFFFPEQQHRWPLFDYEDAREAFTHYWDTFFEWAGRQDELFFIFKGKTGARQYEHPFLRKAMSRIPKEKFYHNDNLPLRDLIEISDCTICGGEGNASLFFNSLCMGVPSISYDIWTVGYTVAEKEKYNDYLVAHEPNNLMSNLEHILCNGLSDEVYEKVRMQHHAEGKLDNRTFFRMKQAIGNLTQGKEKNAV